MNISKVRDDFYLYRQKQKRIEENRKSFQQFSALPLVGETRFQIEFDENKFIQSEATKETVFDRQYIYHTSWAFKTVLKIKPEIHTDISSSLYFIGMLSVIQKTNFFDYRPAPLVLDNLKCGFADLTNLPFDSDSIESLSCMHVIEHIGLGRYGDTLDYNGDIKAISELKRVVKKGGNLLFVVPIGNIPKIIFNLHRIYTHEQIISYFEDFDLKEFNLIPEDEKDGGIVINPGKELLNRQNYACGCYLFTKK